MFMASYIVGHVNKSLILRILNHPCVFRGLECQKCKKVTFLLPLEVRTLTTCFPHCHLLSGESLKHTLKATRKLPLTNLNLKQTNKQQAVSNNLKCNTNIQRNTRIYIMVTPNGRLMSSNGGCSKNWSLQTSMYKYLAQCEYILKQKYNQMAKDLTTIPKVYVYLETRHDLLKRRCINSF